MHFRIKSFQKYTSNLARIAVPPIRTSPRILRTPQTPCIGFLERFERILLSFDTLETSVNLLCTTCALIFSFFREDFLLSFYAVIASYQHTLKLCR